MSNLADDNPPGDDRQVSGQAALAAEVSQDGQIVLDDRQKNVGRQVLAIFAREPQRTALGRMIHDVNHQTHEAIHKILPRSGLASQAALQEIAVDLRECHKRDPYESLIRPGRRRATCDRGARVLCRKC